MTIDRAALAPWGWGPFFDEGLAASGVCSGEPARIVTAHRIALDVQSARGSERVTVPGRLHRAAAHGQSPAPSVGDWVVLARSGGSASVAAVLPRRSKLSRKAAGVGIVEQVLAANVDLALVVAALDGPPNLPRIERFLALVRAGGVEPVVVLSKADLSPDVDAARASVASIAGGAPVHAISARAAPGCGALESVLVPARTLVLLGPSGVGKSTIVNRWLGGEVQTVRAVRVGGEGRHTTTQRALLRLPGGALVIDTPGVRELALWDTGETLPDAFEDVLSFSGTCRFRDCTHEVEPDCAVRRAVDEGRLDRVRWESFVKLRREARAR